MPLPPRQRQMLDALISLNRQGESPTVREVAAEVGLRAPATAMKHLQRLEAAGLIEMNGLSRGIRVLRGTGIPVVGRIAAGEPIENDDDCDVEFAGDEDFRRFGFPEIPVSPELFGGGDDLVALRIVGESMIEAGILDGDLAIIRRQPSVENGEIAAVLIDGEGTLKRWQRRQTASRIRLRPANRGFEPIVVRARDRKDVRVFGKYVGLIRGDAIRVV